MNVYESIIILNATLTDETIEGLTARIRELIETQGGEVLKVDLWGRKKMGYEIKKQARGYYVLFLFRGPSSLVNKLEAFFKVTDEVIKFMVVKLEKKQREAALKKLEEQVAAPAEAPATGQAAQAAPDEAPKSDV